MRLRPYQQEVARAVVQSVRNASGLTFSVEIARQGGKNELSAHIELLLLTLSMADGGSIIKCSPTFKPQTIISMRRLKDRLDDYGFGGLYHAEMGYIVALGSARCVFLSAEETSNVVGHTADLLLEVDESQDVSKEKYSKELRPQLETPEGLARVTSTSHLPSSSASTLRSSASKMKDQSSGLALSSAWRSLCDRVCSVSVCALANRKSRRRCVVSARVAPMQARRRSSESL
ncbi:MAG: hypothetical protein M0R22_01550 [Dehalococcoidia bacterium]|nr:hypothetical protein [Dehalococcoidia bacterium]